MPLGSIILIILILVTVTSRKSWVSIFSLPFVFILNSELQATAELLRVKNQMIEQMLMTCSMN